MALIYSVWGRSLSEDYIGIVVLTFAAAETAAALALLTTLTRISGNELLSSCSFTNYDSVPGILGIIDADTMGYKPHYLSPNELKKASKTLQEILY